MTAKHQELKLQGIFLRSSPDFYKTNWIGDSSTGFAAGAVTNTAAFVTFLQNPDSLAGFWVVRQSTSTSTYDSLTLRISAIFIVDHSATTNFKLNVTTASEAKLQIPLVASTITLSGRESKVLLTDYNLGSGSSLLYSTAQVFFSGVIGSKDVVLLYGPSAQEHEFALSVTGTPKVSSSEITVTPGSKVGLSASETVFSVASGFSGLATIFESSTRLVLFADSATASTFFSPVIAAASGDFANYWGIGTNASVLVGGPYLVRTATITGDVLALKGDINVTASAAGTALTVIAPSTVTSVTWNGARVSVSHTAGSSSILVGTIASTKDTIQVPVLSGWKFNNSLPEILSTFDDSEWAVANHTTTNIPFPMVSLSSRKCPVSNLIERPISFMGMEESLMDVIMACEYLSKTSLDSCV